MGQTLEQRINAGVARHQFWFDDFRTSPDVHIHCSFCGDSLLVDYFMFGMNEMSRRLVSWTAQHEKCVAQDVHKTGEHSQVAQPVERSFVSGESGRANRPLGTKEPA